jgi:RNA polymerase sigma factor (sigma-70 family)
MTDQEKGLLAGCLKREKVAWDAFVLQYSSLVYYTIRKTFSLYHAEPETEAVDDLFQEFFLTLFRDDLKKLRKFRGDRGCSLASWLRVVAVQVTIDSLRKHKPTELELAETLSDDSADPFELCFREEMHEALSRAVQTLPPRDRLFFELYYGQGLPPEEVRAILNTSLNAVYTQKSRVLVKLQEALRKVGRW